MFVNILLYQFLDLPKSINLLNEIHVEIQVVVYGQLWYHYFENHREATTTVSESSYSKQNEAPPHFLKREHGLRLLQKVFFVWSVS